MEAFAMVPKEFHASYYYRILVPFEAISRIDPEFVGMVDKSDLGLQTSDRVETFLRSDLNLLYQPLSDNLIDVMGVIRSEMKSKRPIVIIDTDDNMFEVNPLNSAFQNLGVKRPDGTPLREGDKIEWTNDKGEKRVLWEDGKNGFDVMKNWYRIETYKKCVKACDLVTCSTPAVEKAVKKWVGDDTPTFVHTNMVIPEHYDVVELADHPNEVRVLWQGSDTHYGDLHKIIKPLVETIKKYPHAKLVFWGLDFPGLQEKLGDQYRTQKWCPYSEYKLRLSVMNHDINLAPLRKEEFEECRSPIKWYESSVIHRPAATLAQRTGQFAIEIEDGVTGMLFETEEEFVTKLSTLIEDATKRKEIASNAKDWVISNRSASKLAPILREKWEETINHVNPKLVTV